jgi:hypothetical protein
VTDRLLDAHEVGERKARSAAAAVDGVAETCEAAGRLNNGECAADRGDYVGIEDVCVSVGAVSPSDRGCCFDCSPGFEVVSEPLGVFGVDVAAADSHGAIISGSRLGHD